MRYQVTVERSVRRTLSIQVTKDGNVVIRAPKRMSAADIQKFVDEKQEWIAGAVESVRRKQATLQEVQPLTDEEMQKLYDDARLYLPERCAFFARQMDVSFGRITIRNQKTLWGSCSASGDLSFNVGLMLAPPEMRDYVVVHELCHRKEMNHSPAFWRQVEKVLPDYKERRKWLRTHGDAIMKQIHG